MDLEEKYQSGLSGKLDGWMKLLQKKYVMKLRVEKIDPQGGEELEAAKEMVTSDPNLHSWGCTDMDPCIIEIDFCFMKAEWISKEPQLPICIGITYKTLDPEQQTIDAFFGRIDFLNQTPSLQICT